MRVVQMSYSDDMDDLMVLRDKVGCLREEIADIQKLNEQFRREGWNGADAQVAHRQPTVPIYTSLPTLHPQQRLAPAAK